VTQRQNSNLESGIVDHDELDKSVV